MESARMARYLLDGLAASDGDAQRLAREVNLPPGAVQGEDVMISPQYALRIWEVAEHRTGMPDLPLDLVARYRLGQLDLFDYLFSAAATLRDGFQATMEHLPLLTTNARLQIESQTDDETTFSYRYLDATGRGAELALQFSAAILCRRAAAGTGHPVVPSRLQLVQPAQRSYGAIRVGFGTRDIEFGAPVTSMTFRTRDLNRPMRGADPALARILTRYATTLAPPRPTSWQERFRWLLTQLLEEGTPSLDTMARRLSVSGRTLQRQLAGHGTTWRAELDVARQRLASSSPQANQADVARQLGYAHARSVRRAQRRWRDASPE
jgi:AraC-like DNA-binding protein